MVDEIDAYLAGRFLTASEAVWRFLELPLHKEFPNIVRLDVHLPEMQTVVYDPTADVRDIYDAADRSSSTLLEWFALNRRDANARQLLYTDIPEHYVWKNDTWFPRTQLRISVARMYSVSVHNQELFALRTLLKCQRGCTNFADIITVDGFVYKTFREACAALGFLENDAEFIAAFTEYLETSVASTKSIRHQFALMLCCIRVACATALFEHFLPDLIADETRYAALLDIESKMRSMNRSLTDDDFQISEVPIVDVPFAFPEIDDYGTTHNLPPLSLEQQQAMSTLLAMVQGRDIDNGNVLAIIASAGSGKTVFIKHATAIMRMQGKKSVCVAASALAATLLPNGQTAHAALHIPIICDEQSFCTWDIETKKSLKSIDVLFWDEVSMVSYHVAETVDRSFRYLMGNNKQFGGKIVVFCGDFRQLPPVVKPGNGEHYSLLTRDWFTAVRKATFTTNFRQSGDATYENLLPLIGDGTADEIEIPPTSTVDSLDAAIGRIYGNNVTDDSNAGCVMLAFTLHQCSIVNEAVFNKIPGDAYYSIAVDDCSDCKTPDEYPSEYIASLFIPGIPPGNLALKPKARYMICRNFNPPTICNGIMAELIRATRFNCTLKLQSGPGQGSIVVLPRITFHVPSNISGLPFNFSRRQFPICPSYCLSVHKSQGQSLRRVGFVADTDAFSHGQVFVAMSRVGGWSQFVFYSPRGETFIKNKVSRRLINAMNCMADCHQ